MLYSKVFFRWVIFISNNGICCIKGGSNTFLATCLVVRAVVKVLISMHRHGPAYKFLLCWSSHCNSISLLIKLTLRVCQVVFKTRLTRSRNLFLWWDKSPWWWWEKYLLKRSLIKYTCSWRNKISYNNILFTLNVLRMFYYLLFLCVFSCKINKPFNLISD